MRKIILFILFSVCAVAISAQTHSSADKLFQAGEYKQAQEQYGKLLKSYPTNALYLYRYARCAQEQSDFNTAIQYFDKAGDRYMLKYFYLGEIYLQLWYAEAAITAYNKYLSSLREPNEREAYIHQQIRHAEKIQRYLKRVERLSVLDSMLVPKNEMLAQCHLSNEAGYIQYDSIGGIQYTNQRKDHRIWSSQKDSTQILLSSHRLLDTWTEPDTLPSAINFTTCQLSPYLLNDGITLYFAANDTNGLGGLDIYFSRYNTATELYTTPENMGLPYNSPGNEYMLILDEVQAIGYLATDHLAPEGYVHIYSFMLQEPKQYWRGIPIDTLVEYAQFRRIDKVDSSVINPTYTIPMQIVQDTTNDNGIHFILNDSVVYISTDEFRSLDAKNKYIKWEQLTRQHKAEQQQLTSLRKQYIEGDSIVKNGLKGQILKLENNHKNTQYLHNLLNEIRQIEMSAR
jgi:tetratricopeptide (TPR) repeat protein